MVKRIIIPVLMVFAGQLAYTQHRQHNKPAAGQRVLYTCPMHPEVQQSKPGECPKCGMALEKKAIKSGRPAKKKTAKSTRNNSVNDVQPVTYTCSMHPEIHAAKPGNCPKCGMELVKEEIRKSPKPSATKEDEMKMPMKDSPERMDGMKMDNADATMDNIKKAKANLGPIRTIANSRSPRTVRYDLYVADTVVTFGKKSKRAIAVNGQIPMPTLTFTEGDTAEIYVHNNLKEETSLHWHGLFLPNKEDGVPYLTQMPIKPGKTYLYKFPIIQHGTHWYHSHTELQEQIGMYGAFIMNKRKEWDIPTLPVVISEWTNMKPREVDSSNGYFPLLDSTTITTA